jgi:hypothetical protein
MGGNDKIAMSDPFIHDDTLVAAALRQNWDHARHVERQRLYLLAIYVAMAAALGSVSVHGGDPYLRVGATFLALCATLIAWGISHKLGQAFANQVWHADRCARRLAIQSLDGGSNEYIALHGYIGFPRKPVTIAGLPQTVRLLFDLLYGTFTVAWAILLAYMAFRQFWPAPVL